MNCFPLAKQGLGGLPAQPHTSRRELLTLTGFPLLSNEMLALIVFGGCGVSSATKKSLYALHIQLGHSYVRK